MYAVVRTGGKQYRVEPGMLLDVEKLEGSAGDSISFEEVLLVADDAVVKVGSPLVSGASVQAEIVSQKKAKKVIIFKKIRRQGKRLKKGHRQSLTRVLVKQING